MIVRAASTCRACENGSATVRATFPDDTWLDVCWPCGLAADWMGAAIRPLHTGQDPLVQLP
jgi:hypothetical protein